MKRQYILLLTLFVVMFPIISSCSAESTAPISVEGTWMGRDENGTQITVTFLDAVKAGEGDNSKLCISIDKLIIYTSGRYVYSDGYVSMAFFNSLSRSAPEFYATMCYEGNGSFIFKIISLDTSFEMRRLN